jgi:hypothetical protein
MWADFQAGTLAADILLEATERLAVNAHSAGCADRAENARQTPLADRRTSNRTVAFTYFRERGRTRNQRA